MNKNHRKLIYTLFLYLKKILVSGFLVNLVMWIIKMYTMTSIPDTPNINNKWINLNFNRDINIYVSDLIDETVPMKQQVRGECLSQLIHTKTAWNYPWRNPGKHYQPTGWPPCTWHNSAPTSDCGGNTPLCAPIKSACHIRRRKSCSGSGPLTYLPWFNTKSLG